MALPLYGAGLRVLECFRLRAKDVDFATNQIVVRKGKGYKNRVTTVAATVKVALAAHLDRVHEQHQADLRRGAGWVEPPGVLARKYPNAGREWGWQRVFPATRMYRDRAGTSRSRRSSSRMGRTSARCKSCSAIATSAPPRSTPTCSNRGPSRVRSPIDGLLGR